MDRKPHSAAYFGEQRDFWWNRDFLELMVKRWGVGQISSVLDVGCGIGHWGQMLSTVLPEKVKITGIDREPVWVEKAQQRVKGFEDRFEYKVGLVEEIPFPKNTFDIVTCQTVLIHVPDVKLVIGEMLRVLKPGGLLVVAEPNNCASDLIFDSITVNDSISDIIQFIQFHMTCERGKQKLGLGFESIGDVLPVYFHSLAVEDIQIYQSDKTTPYIPPYDNEEQQVGIKQMKEWVDSDFLLWSKADTKKYFLAGGGVAEDFEPTWQRLKQYWQRALQAIDNRTYATAGGNILYLISGRKPKSRRKS